jgi:hypothetical protein
MPSLKEIRDLVRNSRADEWYALPEGGPTYRSRLEFSTGPSDRWELREESHHTILGVPPRRRFDDCARPPFHTGCG